MLELAMWKTSSGKNLNAIEIAISYLASWRNAALPRGPGHPGWEKRAYHCNYVSYYAYLLRYRSLHGL
jgi:hypothetical protein